MDDSNKSVAGVSEKIYTVSGGALNSTQTKLDCGRGATQLICVGCSCLISVRGDWLTSVWQQMVDEESNGALCAQEAVYTGKYLKR